MKKYIALIIVGIFAMVGITSCKKDKPIKTTSPDLTSEIIIEEINNFRPEEQQMGIIYQKFVAQKLLYANELKNCIADQQIDSAKWNIETYLNSTYGFRSKDTCYKNDEIIDTITFTIKGYNNNIPIVDGTELNTFLNAKESSFAQEISDGDNIDFWCNMINVIGISGGNVTVTMNMSVLYVMLGYIPPAIIHKTFRITPVWMQLDGADAMENIGVEQTMSTKNDMNIMMEAALCQMDISWCMITHYISLTTIRV